MELLLGPTDEGQQLEHAAPSYFVCTGAVLEVSVMQAVVAGSGCVTFAAGWGFSG